MNTNSTTGQALRYNRVRAFLKIESDAILQFKCPYDNLKPRPKSSGTAKDEIFIDTNLPSSTVDPPSSLLEEGITRKLPNHIRDAIGKLTKVDIEKMNSSPAILKLIEALIQETLEHAPINNQEQKSSAASDRILPSGEIVHNVPILFEVVGKSKLAKFKKANDIVVRM